MKQLGTFFSIFAQAKLYESPLLNRIKMVKKRCNSYPMDSLDFILIDLEHPQNLTREADFCTGDLTGRYLDFLSASIHLDSSDSERLDTLFNRILKCQTSDGAFGINHTYKTEPTKFELVFKSVYKLFIGLLRYYIQTGNTKALVAAIKNVDLMFSNLDYIKETLEEYKRIQKFDIILWFVEPFAILYGITGDERYVDMCKIVRDVMRVVKIDSQHSHGFLTTLRGFQLAAIYTGDESFNELPEKFRKEISERAVWADGNITEGFPISSRNEGCSIADWIMLNLYAGFITGADEAYDKAENALHNAMFLNQLVNGGFGHRELITNEKAYRQGVLSQEAWWCCLHNCGLAMVEYADHSVTLKDGDIRVNLLNSGQYTINHEGRSISIDIATSYPEKVNTIILVSGALESMNTRIRIPSCVKNASIKKDVLPNGIVRYTLTGKIGYTLQHVEDGVVLRYGPLVMVPLDYNIFGTSTLSVEGDDSSIPVGYLPEVNPKGRPSIVPPEKDEDGFYLFPKKPAMLWKNYEEGFASRLAYEDLSINVLLRFTDGQMKYQRFWPECYSTTALIGGDVPLIFGK